MFNPKAPFSLEKLPPPVNFENCPNLVATIQLMNDAQKQISELKGSLDQISNPGLFLNPFYLHESIQSNAVENIHTTIESAMKDELKPVNERKRENKEIINYRTALLNGWASQKKFGLSTRTIKTIHQHLNVERGEPGELRKIQNQIANKTRNGTTEILYTPPIAAHVEKLLSNLEFYADRNNDLLPLIKIAICHYQFEAIHPFEDGNGRTGRILMVLQFLQENLLSHPVLFISSYLSKYESEYKKLLLEVSKNGAWWDFISFMVNGFAIQAMRTKITLLKLDKLKFQLREKLYNDENSNIRKANIDLVTNHLFQNPFTNAQHMAKSTNIHWQTCAKYLTFLAAKNFLEKEKSGRYVIYANLSVLDAMKDD